MYTSPEAAGKLAIDQCSLTVVKCTCVSEWVCMCAARLGALRCRLNVKTFDIAAEIPSTVRIRK